MTLDEIKAALQADHNIDLDALLARPEKTDDTSASTLAALTALLEKSGVIKLSAGDDAPDPAAVVAAVTELTNSNTALHGRVDVLELSAVEAEVDGLIATGRVLPAQKDAMIKLARADRDTFDGIVPAEPIVKMSAEQGADPASESVDGDKLDSEIERILKDASLTSEGK